MFSSLAHIFNTDILRTVVELNIRDGQVVESRSRSVDGESMLEILVHDAIGEDVSIGHLSPVHVLAECRVTRQSHRLTDVGGHRRQVLGIIEICPQVHITSHHMENTEAGLQRPLFLRNRLKTINQSINLFCDKGP